MGIELRTSSSDLERARRSSQRLETAEGELAPSAFPFALPAPAAPPVAAPAGFTVALAAGAPWSRIVDHCLAQTGAMGMVVVDESGFVVASAGHWRDWSETHLEAVAARLMAALDQVERLEGPWGACDSLALGLGGDALTGVRVATGAGRLTVALLASQPLPEAVRAGLQAQLQAVLSA